MDFKLRGSSRSLKAFTARARVRAKGPLVLCVRVLRLQMVRPNYCFGGPFSLGWRLVCTEAGLLHPSAYIAHAIRDTGVMNVGAHQEQLLGPAVTAWTQHETTLQIPSCLLAPVLPLTQQARPQVKQQHARVRRFQREPLLQAITGQLVVRTIFIAIRAVPMRQT